MATLLSRTSHIGGYRVLQDLEIAASQLADTELGNNLRLKVHFPKDGFEAGMGAKRIEGGV